MEITVIRTPVGLEVVRKAAADGFGDMVKAVVDVERRVLALGGELHADAERMLLEDGSRPDDLWGINLYPTRSRAEWIEFQSLINIRPAQGNRSLTVENEPLRQQIAAMVNQLIRS